MNDTPKLNQVLGKLPDAKRSGKGWSARCPAHDDCSPSLSISEGSDGRVLLNCHAGCSVEDICKSIGITVADLMPGDGNGAMPSATRNGKPSPAFWTRDEAIEAVEQGAGGSVADIWPYHDADGHEVAAAVRLDLGNGKKSYRPIVRRGEQWAIGGLPDSRPLYRLPELADAKRVYVCEGEKAADAARSIDLIATTSANGSGSSGKTDWSPLAGREVVILPDNDEPGEEYAEAVAEILATLKPAATVKVLHLPDLPEKGDIYDWLEGRNAIEPKVLQQQINTMADEQEAAKLEPIEPAVKPFRPFPVDALPEPVRGFVVDGAKAIGCDPCYIALPLLSAVAAAIGNTRRLELKQGWTEPPILWTAIIGDSGTMKSPAIGLALEPAKRRQAKAMQQHAEQMGEHTRDTLQHEKELAAWKRSKGDDSDPPEAPETPVADRYCFGNATIEATIDLLQTQPRGLLLACDELAGWVGSFDRYASGKGGDSPFWLEMHGGRSYVCDRKTGLPRTIYIPRAAVCIAGGIQPGVLQRSLKQEYRENGMAARLLLAWPPRQPKQWTEDEVSSESTTAMNRLFDQLYGLKFITGDDGEPKPGLMHLSLDGKRAWIKFYTEHAAKQVELSGDLAAAWSKLEGYAARLALVVHYIRWAANDPTLTDEWAVDAVSIQTGVEMVRWFGYEAERVYGMMGETEGEQADRSLIEWITQRGGEISPNELRRARRRFKKSDQAREALQELVAAGQGRWATLPPGKRGGEPKEVFRLKTANPVAHNLENAEHQEVSGYGQQGSTPDTHTELVAAAAEGGSSWGVV